MPNNTEAIETIESFLEFNATEIAMLEQQLLDYDMYTTNMHDRINALTTAASAMDTTLIHLRATHTE